MGLAVSETKGINQTDKKIEKMCHFQCIHSNALLLQSIYKQTLLFLFSDLKYIFSISCEAEICGYP